MRLIACGLGLMLFPCLVSATELLGESECFRRIYSPVITLMSQIWWDHWDAVARPS
ncbi:unnamed protein product [Periconia digitata]|uniref:Uncharacterized protein n=1 Tax=Periconia digitata TaxID=1303443 RepID=A0A9W4UPA4_9PLEO|nr:unnamed protein product [Periconia digitata]